ncbi:peptide deformylase [Micrococcus porci]|uniref:peptide deformylase n=1 Tax=Micrococcus porci TaxID=2856555 RepID=UPI001CCE516D|nr:peptide deformylase [Micrococcus porci]UBH23962.1 peptide deformylase [Micrococcus porci]
MTVLTLRTVPDPVLRTPAAPVAAGQDVRALVEDMVETMHAVGGVGLAAPQVGVGLRVFVFDCAGASGHVLNPVLETFGSPVREPGEGCLSVPGLRYHPARAERAVVRGVDVDGNPVEHRGEGLLARCLQHETDHLDGILYVDRLDGDDRREARRRLRADAPDPEAERIRARRDALAGSVFGARPSVSPSAARTTPRRGAQ